MMKTAKKCLIRLGLGVGVRLGLWSKLYRDVENILVPHCQMNTLVGVARVWVVFRTCFYKKVT